MLQFSNCCLEDFKTWRSYNTGWEGIPLYDRQWKEGVLVIVLACMDLPESYLVAISGDPMIGLYVVWDGYSY